MNAEARDLLDRGFDRQTRAEQDLHEAIAFYERVVDADPSFEKAHYQLVGVLVALGRSHDAVARYERRLAEQPDLLSHRCLAQAYVGAGRWDEARRTIAAGLALAPGDAFLLEQEGELLERTGRADDALDAWQRALDADPNSIGGHYSRAFLLERLGRRDDAVAEWRAIVDWCRERGYAEDLEWPRRELERLGDEAAI